MFKIEKITGTEKHSALSINNYAGSLTELAEDGFTPVSIEDLVYQRLQFGAYHEISWTGSRTTDFFVYKNDKYYLAHANLVGPDKTAIISALQDFHENRTEIPYVKGFLLKPINIAVEDSTVPVDEFTTNPITQYLFGQHAEAYGKWLKNIGIEFFPVALPPYSLAREQEAFIRPLILRCTDNWSGVITANADMHNLYGFRGTSTTYEGEVSEPETFTRDRLEIVNRLLPLEDKTYSLNELEELLTVNGYASLLNGLLRFVRNSGNHSLPAYHATFNQ